MTQTTQRRTNVSQLRGAIYAKYHSMTDFAKEINWTRQRLSRYLHGSITPNIEECNMIADTLGMSDSDIVRIFFGR